MSKVDNMTVSYRTEFESCYVQSGELHAHRYRVEITVDGPQRYEDTGRVIEFADLSRYLKEAVPDKKFLHHVSGELDDTSRNENDLAASMQKCGVDVVLFDDIISVELLCTWIRDRVQFILDFERPGVRVIEVKLRETTESFATWSI